jgi:hypothetical protein
MGRGGEPDREAPDADARPPVAAAVVVTVTVLGLLAPLLIARHYGALGIPRSDDWSYLVTLFRLVDSGRLSFNHWVSMHLVGQLALGAPIAAVAHRNVTAQQVLTLVLGGVALATTALTARELRLATTARVLAVLSLAASPFWGALVVSYMTDVPALAFSSLATWLAVRAWTRPGRGTGLLLGSVASAFYATSIRQYAVVTLIAVVAVAILDARRRADGRGVRMWITTGVVAGIAVVALDLWWRTIPDGRSLSPTAPSASELGRLVTDGAGFVRVCALCLLPVLVWAAPLTRLREAWRSAPVVTAVTAVVTAAWLAATAVRTPDAVFVGNYVTRRGVLSDIVLVGRRPGVLPGPVWHLLVLVAGIAGVVLVTILVAELGRWVRRRRVRTPGDPARTMLALSVAGYAAAYAGAIATGVQVYDRYALAAIGPLGILLLVTAADLRTGHPVPTRVLTAVAASVLVLVGLTFTADSASYDGARWALATRVTHQGWPARTVNGGFEWRNYHRGDKLPAGTRGRGELICVTIHSDPAHRPARIVAVRRSSAPTRPDLVLVAFRTDRDCSGVRFHR